MPGTPRYRGLRRTTTRSALLAAAEELFGLRGFAGVSVDEITARAGVAKGTFYNHFADKADLAHHLALEIRAGMRERIGTPLPSGLHLVAGELDAAIAWSSLAICVSGRATGSTVRCCSHRPNPTPSTAAAVPTEARVKGTGRRPRAPNSITSATAHITVSTAALV